MPPTLTEIHELASRAYSKAEASESRLDTLQLETHRMLTEIQVSVKTLADKALEVHQEKQALSVDVKSFREANIRVSVTMGLLFGLLGGMFSAAMVHAF